MKLNNDFLILIPARYASTRFPGKPLARLGDKTVIQHVYDNVSLVANNVAVATDDLRIIEAVEVFGGKAVMTSTEHRSGTDRCREAMHKLNTGAKVVINVQGDEPFVAPSQILALAGCFDDERTQIATLTRRFNPERGFEALFDPNLVKLVKDNEGFALYFSRSIIPYVRNSRWEQWLDKTTFFTHVGIYAYRSEVLDQLASLAPSSLETAESLEQLRWLQNGYHIKVEETDVDTIGIDTLADLEAARQYLESRKN